jgi:hypothetical protein
MPAKDKFHDVVKTALQKDGWVITSESLYIPLERITGMYIDLAAEKILVADRQGQKIAVEVKSFINPSPMSDFHTAIGQFINYRYGLAAFEPDRILYLAVPLRAYEDFFTTPFVQSVIKGSQINLLVYNPATEEIVRWQN